MPFSQHVTTPQNPASAPLYWRSVAFAESWIETASNTEPAVSHTRALTGLIIGIEYEVALVTGEEVTALPNYVHPGAVPEIQKVNMAVLAASADQQNAPLVVDGMESQCSRWAPTPYNPNATAWLCMDLGSRYRVVQVGYRGLKANHGMKDYEIFVSDVLSGAKED